jgi:hypothetical protein
MTTARTDGSLSPVASRLPVLVATVLAGAALVYGVHLGASEATAAPRRGRAVAPRAAPPLPEGVETLDWSLLLSYDHRPGLEGLPDAIKALDGKHVALQGFLLPNYEYDDIRDFSLVANHMSCCFGLPAGINGQVHVRLKGRGLPLTSEPLRVDGVFRAREEKEEGYVLWIYAIDDADAVIVGY